MTGKVIAENGGLNGLAAKVAPALRSARRGGPGVRVRYTPEPEGKKENPPDLRLADCASADELLAGTVAALRGAGRDRIRVAGLGTFEVNPGVTARPGDRLDGRITLVTGAAQGFGEGIARALADAGGTLVIADLNEKLAGEVAASINARYGDSRALAIKVDVSDETSVSEMIARTVLHYGGLDLVVSNAGVLRAGGLEEMDLATFEFVTKVNYTAFFLVTKYAARPMKLAAAHDPQYSADIVQINSKSGLEGSNRNFAYAGGKFGGIGLVQSFAKELIQDRIKVNAICPGNYYEGPLWSDPEKGLFVQYLAAGKVPGARTVDDVYRFYVDKVPMRRGCSPVDVARAVLYCVEQQYETGQAIPVTGGQNMLR